MEVNRATRYERYKRERGRGAVQAGGVRVAGLRRDHREPGRGLRRQRDRACQLHGLKGGVEILFIFVLFYLFYVFHNGLSSTGTGGCRRERGLPGGGGAAWDTIQVAEGKRMPWGEELWNRVPEIERFVVCCCCSLSVSLSRARSLPCSLAQAMATATRMRTLTLRTSSGAWWRKWPRWRPTMPARSPL
jgi:hypothetical protein